MGFTEKAKEITDIALEKAGEYSEKAAEKAAELSETARERAPEFLDRAAEVAGRAVDVAAAGVDKVTGGRFHEHLDTVTTRVGEKLDRTPAATHTHPTAGKNFFPEEPDGPDLRPAPGVAGQAGEPITPATTNPESGREPTA